MCKPAEYCTTVWSKFLSHWFERSSCQFVQEPSARSCLEATPAQAGARKEHVHEADLLSIPTEQCHSDCASGALLVVCRRDHSAGPGQFTLESTAQHCNSEGPGPVLDKIVNDPRPNRIENTRGNDHHKDELLQGEGKRSVRSRFGLRPQQARRSLGLSCATSNYRLLSSAVSVLGYDLKGVSSGAISASMRW